MSIDLKYFWQRLQTGIEVAVAGHAADKLLGVRDGFLRFFHDGLDRTVSVAVVPQSIKQAILLLVSHMNEMRQPEITGTIISKVEFAVNSLLDPYRVYEFR